MFIVYLACLLFGGILVLFSLFSGGEHSDDVSSHSIDSHDFDHHIGDSHAGEISTDSHHIEINKEFATKSLGFDNSSLLSEIGKFFNFRNIIYFITFFGLTGSLGSFMDFGSVFTFFISLLIGSLSAGFGYSFMKYLRKNESGEGVEIYQLQGHNGIAALPITKDRKGKVIIESFGSTNEIIAKLSPASQEEEIKKGDKIVIIEFEDKIAIIDKFDV